MEIRDAYKREFLQVLKESPAWDDFITAILKDMVFLQDSVRFTMGNVSRLFNLREEFCENPRERLIEGEIVRLRIDINNVMIKASNCLLSNDGITWLRVLEVKEEFYIKSEIAQDLRDVQVTCINFYPDMISCNDMKQMFQVFGLQRDDVKFSSFDRYFTATSPYLVNYILKRLDVYYNMEYFYDNGTSIEVTGSKTELVREGVEIQRISGDMFYYNSSLTLIAGSDYIRTEEGDFVIKSVNKNTLTCDVKNSSGKFTVYRSKFITPLNAQYKLKSALEFDFDRSESDLSTRFINRVTPVRCNAGFRGEVDIRVLTSLKAKSDMAIPSSILNVNMKLEDEISLKLNEELNAFLYGLYEGKLRVIDLKYNKYQTDQIILI